MGAQAVGANLSSSNQPESLDLASDGEKRTIRVDNLVLVAGPWTPTLFKMLFPNSSVDMEPVIDAGDWIVFENPEPTSAKSVAAVFLDEIVGRNWSLLAAMITRYGEQARGVTSVQSPK